jgi:hypothetical protein
MRTGGRWLYQVLVELPPGGRSTVELHLSGELAPGPYRLVLDPGGGVTPDVYDVSVDVDGERRIEVDGALTMRTSLP